MRPRSALWGVLLCTIPALACAGGVGGGAEADDSEFVVDFDANLRATRGHAEVQGTARAVASLGNTAVTVALTGAEAGMSYPWHVHYGDCGSGGSIVGSASSYPPITPDAEGSDRVTTTIGVQLNDDSSYHVNVHLSAEEMDVIIACGELVD